MTNKEKAFDVVKQQLHGPSERSGCVIFYVCLWCYSPHNPYLFSYAYFIQAMLCYNSYSVIIALNTVDKVYVFMHMHSLVSNSTQGEHIKFTLQLYSKVSLSKFKLLAQQSVFK